MNGTNKLIAMLKKMVWPGIVSQIVVFGAWLPTGLYSGFSQVTAFLQSSSARAADLSTNIQVCLLNLIRQDTIGGSGGIIGGGGPGRGGQVVYGPPNWFNPGYTPGTWPGGASTLPGGGGQVVYGPPNPFNPGYTPGTWPGGTGTLPGGVQPVYGAPINPGYIPPGNPGTGFGGDQGISINSISVRLTDMISIHQVTPEAVISLAAYTLWILITFWALFGWAFWGLVLYLKKREAFEEQNK